MSILDHLPSGIRRLFRLPVSLDRLMRELDDEIRFHVETRAAALRASGLSERDALAAAMAQFGDTEDLRRYCRGLAERRVRRTRLRDWADEWAHDLRFALRQFARAPGFTITATLMLGLGIGANTALFSVVHHLLLAPLPFADGNRMVTVFQFTGGGAVFLSPPQSFADEWRARSHTVDHVMGMSSFEYTLGDSTRGPTEQVQIASIPPGAFDFVGVQPLLGRGIVPSDTIAGAPPVTVLSEGLWRRAFGASPDALGKPVYINQTIHTVVGVVPDGFFLPFNEDARQLFNAMPAAGGNDRQVFVLAKLRPGFSIGDANREIAAIFPPKSEHNPYGDPPRVLREIDEVSPALRQTVLALFGAVVLVLLIACANVANLVLARSWARQREFAIRAALGAGRWRLIRQMLAESALLAFAGGLLGVGVALAAIHGIRTVTLANDRSLDGVHANVTVLLWTLAMTMLTGVLFGIAPAALTSSARTSESLKAGTLAASGGVRAQRFRSGLVMLEMALSVVLLAGACLLVRTLVSLQHVDVGVKPQGLVGIGLRFTAKPLDDLVARQAAGRAALGAVRSLPGVRGATYASELPPEFGIGMNALEIEGRSMDPRDTIKAMAVNSVSPDYFAVVGLAVRQGRIFPPNPALSFGFRATEVMVNESFAKRFWPTGGVLGARMRRGNGPWMTIVGVVADVHLPGEKRRSRDIQVYDGAVQAPMSSMLVVRSDVPQAKLVAAITAAIHDATPSVRIYDVRSTSELISKSMDNHRFTLELLGAFAGLALLLAAIGLHGVISYSVSQRTREIGVRVALGAQGADVANLVLGQGLRMAGVGILVGAIGAVAATRALASLLYGVSSGDPLTVGGVAAVMLVVAVLATYSPARRASRLDPVEALRAD